MNVEINAKSEALCTASRTGDFENVQNLVKSGADVNFKSKEFWGCIPLILASGYHATADAYLNIVKYLVEEGNANINEMDNFGRTAVMAASWYERMDITKYLVEKGADLKILDGNGWTVLKRLDLKVETTDVAGYLASLKGPLSLQHIILNLIEKKGISHGGLPEILFRR